MANPPKRSGPSPKSSCKWGCEMGLADLKKKHQLHHQKKFTVDEFIEDAEFYAKGKPKVVSLELGLHRDEGVVGAGLYREWRAPEAQLQKGYLLHEHSGHR